MRLDNQSRLSIQPTGPLDNNTTYTVSLAGDRIAGTDEGILLGSTDNFSFKTGYHLWAQQLGTSSDDRGYGVTVDSSNNIYVTGNVDGGALDGNTSSGDNDLFLVKYNSSGTKQWTQQLGTSSQDYGRGVTVDSNNNIYVSGTTGGGLDNNTSSGSEDIFLIKYNSDGVKQ